MYRTIADTNLGLLASMAQGTLPAVAPVASIARGGGEAVAIGGLGLLYTGLLVTSTLFTYGVARSHPDKMVRTTGYIMTGVGVLGVLGALIGTVGMSAQAATR